MPAVLIDTSAWIDFFRDSGGKAGESAAELIRLDHAFITGPVIAELLHGCRGKKETVQLQHLFAAVPCVDIIREDWQAAGECMRALREKGLAVPLSDAVIAVVAARNKMAVLTLDKHFQHLPVETVKIPI
jgi:predicted nucleic acid-binding protein